MCGRYASTRDPATLAIEFDAVDGTRDSLDSRAGTVTLPRADNTDYNADYNIAPTKPVLSVVTRHPRNAQGAPDPDRTERSIRVMRWGLVPHWAKDPGIGSRMINARAESAASKPAFRDAMARRRCLLPADGWYEWQAATGPGAGKQPYFITPADGSGLAFAGLWSTWRTPDAPDARDAPDAPDAPDVTAPPLITCAVLTTAAVGPLTEIHHRMPLLLPADAWADWLNPDSRDPEQWLAPPAAELVRGLELRPVSTAVNNVRHQGPELIERIDPEQPALLDLDQVR